MLTNYFSYYVCSIAYAVWMLEYLLQKHSDDDIVEVFVMYDIACMLQKHLQVHYIIL